MLDILLDDLSNKLDALLCCQKAAREENKFLHEMMAKLKLEQAKLQEKNQLAADKTKAIIEKLNKQYYE